MASSIFSWMREKIGRRSRATFQSADSRQSTESRGSQALAIDRTLDILNQANVDIDRAAEALARYLECERIACEALGLRPKHQRSHSALSGLSMDSTSDAPLSMRLCKADGHTVTPQFGSPAIVLSPNAMPRQLFDSSTPSPLPTDSAKSLKAKLVDHARDGPWHREEDNHVVADVDTPETVLTGSVVEAALAVVPTPVEIPLTMPSPEKPIKPVRRAARFADDDAPPTAATTATATPSVRTARFADDAAEDSTPTTVTKTPKVRKGARFAEDTPIVPLRRASIVSQDATPIVVQRRSSIVSIESPVASSAATTSTPGSAVSTQSSGERAYRSPFMMKAKGGSEWIARNSPYTPASRRHDHSPGTERRLEMMADRMMLQDHIFDDSFSAVLRV
eukprot:TRINITY_DN9813_c0_g1_i1.p2 TRINITY_DN9813_c0_g1~~TRINITY_DN9813_c0_g1_i1.p2  ORF type:complete len:393 (+),score=72.15 TRINITY_DN9813_c0_g1_i1:70-1248(+)